LPVIQSPKDIFRKFKFDKLDRPTIKSRRLSADSFDHVELANELPHYENTVPQKDEKQVKYGQAWLMQFDPVPGAEVMIGSVRSFVPDSGRLMTPEI
jgi:hypothetical protein